MTGPEHYAEAERLRDVAEGLPWYEEDGMLGRVTVLLAAAQVHATLALAAATAEAATGVSHPHRWAKVTQ